MAIQFDPNSLKSKPKVSRKPKSDTQSLWYALAVVVVAGVVFGLHMYAESTIEPPPPPPPQMPILTPQETLVKAQPRVFPKTLPESPSHQQLVEYGIRTFNIGHLQDVDFRSASEMPFAGPGRYLVLFKKEPDAFLMRNIEDSGTVLLERYSATCIAFQIDKKEGLQVFNEFSVEGIYKPVLEFK